MTISDIGSYLKIGGQVVIWGHNLPPLVEIELTDLTTPGWAIAPPAIFYTPGGFVWCDRPFYLVKLSQEKWLCDFHDDATPLSFQLQVAEVFT